MYAPRLKICLSLTLQYEFAGTLRIFVGQGAVSMVVGLNPSAGRPRFRGEEPSTYVALRATDPRFVSRSLRGPGTVRPNLPQARAGPCLSYLIDPLSQQCAHGGTYPVMLLIWLTV